MTGTRVYRIRIPTVLWNDLVASGRLSEMVHHEIETGMWRAGYVKVQHGRRWFWFKKEDVDRVAAEGSPLLPRGGILAVQEQQEK